jgi:DNA-binding NtrC family response regulator
MEGPGRVLIVEDDEGMAFFLREAFLREGYDVDVAAGGADAIQILEEKGADVAVIDIRLPGMDGLELMERISAKDRTIPCIVITAFGSKEVALDAIERGAYDYLTKPIDLHELRIITRRAMERKRLLDELRDLKESISSHGFFPEIVGESEGMRTVYDLIERVAEVDVNVLICGESGTGKELVARAIHRRSRRKERPLIIVNCAAIPEGLLETELFGHEKGAFTGASSKRMGKFELADGGTIFLDEVGDMSMPLQAKILRVLQSKEFERVGGTRTIKVDVRVISATNKDLKKMVERGEFRKDLYYRLNVVQIDIPPLRNRKEDIPLLVDHFIRNFSEQMGKEIKGISPRAMEFLLSYNWPGNVRELEHVIQRAIVLEKGDTITDASLPPEIREAKEPHSLSELIKGSLGEMEARAIKAALESAGGNRSVAAKILGVSRKTLFNKMRKYGIRW